MEQLILDLIKYSVFLFCTLYCFAHLLRIQISAKFLINFPVCLLLSLGLHYLTIEHRYLIPAFLLIISCLYNLLLFRKSFYETTTHSIISVGLNFFILTISYVITIPISMILMNIKNQTLALIISTSLCSIINILFSILLFKIKKFKKGIIALKNDSVFLVLIFISLLIICLITIYYIKLSHLFLLLVAFFIITIVGFLVICIWKIILSNKYKNEVFHRNITIYEQAINDLNKQINDLMINNDNLSKIIHRDNKVITPIELGNKKIINDNKDSQKINELICEIENLSLQRGKLIQEYTDANSLNLTNSISIDSTLIYINSLAKKNNIKLHIFANTKIKEILDSNNIDVIDFNSILCDLSENAIYAVKNAINPEIELAIEIIDSTPKITISDNGEIFDENVLLNIGKTKITTRKNQGGSGIGLMSIFEILKRYEASFYLDEALQNTNYSKSIIIHFNNTGSLKINTNRFNIKKCFEKRINIFN